MRHTYRITHGEASLGILGDRNRFPPPGARGGEPGSRQTVVINPDTPESSDIGMLVADR